MKGLNVLMNLIIIISGMEGSIKQVGPVFVEKGDLIIIITVYAFYF